MPSSFDDPTDRTPLLWRDLRARTQSAEGLPFYRQEVQLEHGALKHKDVSGKNAHDQFCALTGCPPSNRTDKDKFHVPKKSLYGRATSQLSSQRRAYNVSASVNNLLLLSQVILGAALTALGASASSHILITIFGATNTIIAGLVAYLKSRGQPMRARMYRDDLERIVDEIENSEIMWRGISEGVHGYKEIDTDEVTVRTEVARLTRLYDRAIRLNGMNNPDMYMAGAGGFDSNTSGGVRPSRGVAGSHNVTLPAIGGPAPQPSAPNPGSAVPTVESPEDAAPATAPDTDKDKPAETPKEETKKDNGKQPATDGSSENKPIEKAPAQPQSASSGSSEPAAKPAPPSEPVRQLSQPQQSVLLIEDDPDASPATAARLKPKRTKSDKSKDDVGKKVAGDDE